MKERTQFKPVLSKDRSAPKLDNYFNNNKKSYHHVEIARKEESEMRQAHQVMTVSQSVQDIGRRQIATATQESTDMKINKFRD